jgi:hypothetical protein
VDAATIVQIVFAASAALAALSLAAAAFDRVGHRTLVALAVVSGLVAVGGWVVAGIEREADIFAAAAGMSLAFAAQVAAIRLRDLVRTARRVDEQLARAHGRLNSMIAHEAEERGAELERTLARARADSASLLADQERKLAEERRAEAAERGRTAEADLGAALTRAQQQVDARLAAWADDLERAHRAVADQIAQLAQRQKVLIAEAESRIAADSARLESESDEQRASLIRVREEIARATQEAIETGTTELDGYASERRRALHELNERIRKRERQLTDLIEREENDAVRRIQAGFSDVERRQLEQLDRILTRATSSYSDAAAQQFADTVKSSREAAAVRLSRELERAVQSFAREAQTALAERLARVGDAGVQRLERRQTEAVAGLERQQIEATEAFEGRLMQAEQELRRRLDTLAADAEAERAVLDARLRELAKRLDETFARS